MDNSLGFSRTIFQLKTNVFEEVLFVCLFVSKFDDLNPENNYELKQKIYKNIDDLKIR